MGDDIPNLLIAVRGSIEETQALKRIREIR